MAPEPDDERMWPGGGSEPPRVTACRRDGPPPHTHVWTACRRPGGTLQVEVCIRCHQVKWDHLDAQVRVLLELTAKRVIAEVVMHLTADDPEPPSTSTSVDVPLPGP